MAPLDVMRRYVAAIRAIDRDAAFALLADDVVGTCRAAPRWPTSGGAARRSWATSRRPSATPKRSTSRSSTCSSARSNVALLVHERLTRPDRALDMRRCNVYRVRDEEIVEIWIFEGDQYAVDEFMP